jgi:hypothetical protein
MIRYALVCDEDHTFDAWFRSGTEFEQQQALGLVTCLVCGSVNVQRALMAPNVVTGRVRQVGADVEPMTQVTPPPDSVPVAALPDPRQKAMIEALSELKCRITAAADNVGAGFAEEARKIHYGEAPERGIYGVASREDAMALFEEGIEVHALPILPDERN